MTSLDNPVWSSLSTIHARFAIAHGGVLRFQPEVAPFVAVEGPRAIDPATLDALVGDGTSFLLGPTVEVPAGWQLESLGTIAQMVCERPLEVPDGPAIELLASGDRSASEPSADQDRSAILELAALVYPHYFRPRTAELGRYHGIRANDGSTGGPLGRLDAMIGERMAMPGLREISAVCTHPECVGRGLARRLLAHASNAIFAAGETPFLHVSPANTRAVQLYEQNGYRRRIDVPFWSLRRA